MPANNNLLAPTTVRKSIISIQYIAWHLSSWQISAKIIIVNFSQIPYKIANVTANKYLIIGDSWTKDISHTARSYKQALRFTSTTMFPRQGSIWRLLEYKYTNTERVMKETAWGNLSYLDNKET